MQCVRKYFNKEKINQDWFNKNPKSVKGECKVPEMSVTLSLLSDNKIWDDEVSVSCLSLNS